MRSGGVGLLARIGGAVFGVFFGMVLYRIA
jgi:hypothetical protein